MKNEAYITLKVKLGVETISFDTDEYFVTVESAEVVGTDISEHMLWMCVNGEFDTTDVDANMVLPSTIGTVLATPPKEES